MIACGARPNFMKVASLVEAFGASARIRSILVHTGQHFDANMSRRFFDELGLPPPDVNLGCGGGSHAGQTAEILQRFEPVLLREAPQWLFVVGDVNSTLACALVAAKCGVPVAHVEAGLRSFDRSMPEEINRLLTDRLSALLFVTEPAGMKNLAREGVPADRCHLVGDTLADTLLRFLPRARQSDVRTRLGLDARRYALMTLHRPSNVDDAATLAGIFDGIAAVAKRLPVVFAVHPRTAQRIDRFGLRERVNAVVGLRVVEPVGYLDFLKLMAEAALVISDSGGIQEETTILNVPCLTLRETTERPYTVETGTNRLVRPAADAIRAAFEHFCSTPPPPKRAHPLTDGRAARRITEILLSKSPAPASSKQEP